MTRSDIPQCFTHYDIGDPICDGDPEVAGDVPCVWRDRCSAMKLGLADTGESLSEYGKLKKMLGADGVETARFQAKNYDALTEKCDQFVEAYGIKDGKQADEDFDEDAEEVEPGAEEEPAAKPKKASKATPEPEGEPAVKPKKVDGRSKLRPSRKAKAAARKALIRLAKERHVALNQLFRQFVVAMAEAIPMCKWAGPKEAVTPGSLYVMNRLKSSGYASVYCKSSMGRDVPLVLVRFKPRDLTMEVEMPFGADDMSAAARKRLEPRPFSDGKFKIKTKKLDREGLGLAADAISAALKAGHIQLPAEASL